MPRSRWALPFLALFAPHGGSVQIDDQTLELRLGALGRASVPLGLIQRASMMKWPWWAGLGVRIGRGVVAFVSESGPVVLLELSASATPRVSCMRWQSAGAACRRTKT
jgi:hypothetical protein